MPQTVEQLVGSDDEVELYSHTAKLPRVQDNQWKAKGQVRVVLRQEETMTLVSNFYVRKDASHCVLRPNANSDDFSDGLPRQAHL